MENRFLALSALVVLSLATGAAPYADASEIPARPLGLRPNATVVDASAIATPEANSSEAGVEVFVPGVGTVPTPPPRPASLNKSDDDHREAPVVPPTADKPKPAATSIVRGGFERVVCTTEGTLAIRSENLSRVIFAAKRGDRVKLFQGWGNNKKKKKVGGKIYTYVKAQIDREDSRDQNVGWLAEAYVKQRSECASLPKTLAKVPKAKRVDSAVELNADDGGIKVATPEVPPDVTIINPGSGAKSLTSDDCCSFPLATRPTNDYHHGDAQFAGGRSKGRRKHAACDLYLMVDAPIRAIADGEVVRPLYDFYQETAALEIRHPGGYIVRYGEVKYKLPRPLNAGDKVRAGEVIAYMGKVNSNCCEPMLHFELYSGKKTGTLTQKRSRGFQRRSDLMDPTPFLDKWKDNL